MERKRKRELRDLNARAWAGDRDAFSLSDSLDSSMKKNTAFIKRLRTSINAASTSAFLSEIRTLSLHKYLSEIISACYEGLSKLKLPADIATGVEIFSALHQRFGPEEFTGYIGWLIGRGLSTPDKAHLKTLPPDVREKEEKERVSRHRVLLRVATELWLVGGLRSLDDVTRPDDAAVKGKENTRAVTSATQKTAVNGVRPSVSDAEPFPLEVLKDLTSQDGQYVNLPLVVQFLKAFSWDLLGKKGSEDEAVTDEDAPLADVSMQQRFRNILVRYFEGAAASMVKDQAALNKQSQRNAEAYVRSGEVFEDRQANYEKQVKTQERFVGNMQIVADILELDMPDLKEKDSTTTATDGNVGLVKAADYLRGEGDGAGIWEDEDERRFYENLPDLKDRVPSMLLEEPRKKKPDGDEQVGKRVEDKSKVEDTEKDEKSGSKEPENNDPSTAIANKTVGAQVDAILARLPELTSKEMVDDVAYDFCYVNSKASRNRLIKAVQEIPRGRTDLLPLYSRLVTILSKYMPDISQTLVSYLDDEFRSLQRRKQKDSLGGVRTSNVRYLAELTKFGLVPEHVIFHCLKVSLDEFSKMNIEIICNLLENCGRYLLRNPETSPRMKSFLDTLQRKKAAQHLGQQERMLIENATYYVNPPERAAIQQKERTPIDLFVRKLIYLDLSKRNIEKIAKQIRKLHWEDEEVVDVLRKVFVKPANIKYSNVHFLAIILGALNRYHQDFAVSVIDDLLENITLGLELNDFKYNQRRIAEVKYLGELYVYRMVDSSIVFDTMFKILSFGHGGWPRPDEFCPIDQPDDFFRIRLVCNILETCGTYYEKGAAKKKLDFFLTFFQYYIQTKDALPMDIEFIVQDAFALVRPQWKLLDNLEEAGNAFAQACKDNIQKTGSERLSENAEPEEPEDLDDEAELGGRRTPVLDEDKSSGDEADGQPEGQTQTPGEETDEEEEEQIIVTRPEDERDPEAEAEFDRELAKMMAESLETRKSDRRPMFDVALPMRKAPRDTAALAEETISEGPNTTLNTIQFSLLSKKGNRPQTRAIDLPTDSSFAVAMRNQQEAEKAEQQRIKKLVLNYDTLRGDEDDGANGTYILQPNPNHRFRDQASSGGSVADDVSSRYIYPERITEKATSTGSASANGDSFPSRQNAQGGRGSAKKQQSRKLQLSDVDWT